MDELNAFIIEEANKLGHDLMAELYSTTPVDTGVARSGWQLVNTITNVGETLTIKNEVPYVIYLEEGSSQQAPHGFINASITKVLNERNQ
jgi:hypothetical protein